MSFKQNDIINLGNYEEYFILYMDNELNHDQKLMVENFVEQHPQVAGELEMLLSMKLPADDLSFPGKEELLSAGMKANMLDEALFLYVDDELTGSAKTGVEQKIKADKDYALQYALLRQTKLDASEKILHPNKKELFRHSEKLTSFKIWMRVAAAIILLLLGSLFFLTNKTEKLPGNQFVRNVPPAKTPAVIKDGDEAIEQATKNTDPVLHQQAIVKIPQLKNAGKTVTQNEAPRKNGVDLNSGIAKEDLAHAGNDILPRERDVMKFDAGRFTQEPEIKGAFVNNTVAYNPVTSSLANRIIDEGVDEPAVTDGDFKDKKKTPAKGFFRKVSRFIERNTGIGTVNADNELLIGAVALKLK